MLLCKCIKQIYWRILKFSWIYFFSGIWYLTIFLAFNVFLSLWIFYFCILPIYAFPKKFTICDVFLIFMFNAAFNLFPALFRLIVSERDIQCPLCASYLTVKGVVDTVKVGAVVGVILKKKELSLSTKTQIF